MPAAKSKEMTLRILACRLIYSGRNQKGDEYTIYEIDAANAQTGEQINEKLRCFAALPIGQNAEVTVTPFHSEKHGRSFTLHPKGQRSQSSQQQLNELREELGTLRGMISSLATRVAALELGAGSATTSGPQPANASALDQKFGADAPW